MNIQKLKSVKNRILYGERLFLPSLIPNLDIRTIVPVSQAWVGLEKIIKPIIDHFRIGSDSAIEYGVEYGYSTSVLSNYFTKVYGVDLFIGDIHAGFNNNLFSQAKKNLELFANIQLFQSSYQDFQANNPLMLEHYNLAHIDIVHTYEDTYDCGEWAINHSDIVLFHDTQSFIEVKYAVRDLASKYKLKFYNYPYCNGLGILVPKQHSHT